jgi:hypothetical protein
MAGSVADGSPETSLAGAESRPIFSFNRWTAGALICALIAAAPLFLSAGFLNTRGGGDSPFLLFRLHQLYAVLSQGVFPARWMPDAAFGLGYPFFSYYASLPYYFAAAFRAFGLSYVLSLKLTHLAGFLVAALGMMAWLRRVAGRDDVALLGSAAYTFAPYHLVNVYVRGDSLVEFWAMAWYPLILLAVWEASPRPSARSLGWVALAYGALVMTHNVSALISLPFVALYALGCALWNVPAGTTSRLSLQRILVLAVGGLLGLALSAWVWLPALAEQSYVQLGEQTTGYFFYGNHFRDAANLVQPGLFFDYDIGHEVISPFSLGLVQAALTLIGALILTLQMIRSRRWRRAGFLLLGLLLSTLMLTPFSEPVWASVPLLPFAQFPWRFLSIQALFSAAVIGMLAAPISAAPGRRWQPVIVLSLCAALGVTSLGPLRPNFIALNDADVTAQRLIWYESFSGNIGTTIRYEYLPRWTTPRPYASDLLLAREPRAKFLSGAGEAHRLTAGAAGQTWTASVTGGDPARVALPLLYWPGWEARIDGQLVALEPVEGIGYVGLNVPPGQHTLILRLARTPVRLWAELASLAALIGARGGRRHDTDRAGDAVPQSAGAAAARRAIQRRFRPGSVFSLQPWWSAIRSRCHIPGC